MFRRFLVTTTDATVMAHPRQGSFDNVAGATQTAAVRASAWSDQRPNQPTHEQQKEPFKTIAAICLHNFGPSHFAVGSFYFRDRCDRGRGGLVIALVRGTSVYRQRQPACIDNQVAFTACFAAVRRVRAGMRPPKSARMEALSITARDQSIAWASSSSCNNARWSLAQTPSWVHSFKRRQHVA
jgi:hypothetical protein